MQSRLHGIGRPKRHVLLVVCRQDLGSRTVHLLSSLCVPQLRASLIAQSIRGPLAARIQPGQRRSHRLLDAIHRTIQTVECIVRHNDFDPLCQRQLHTHEAGLMGGAMLLDLEQWSTALDDRLPLRNAPIEMIAEYRELECPLRALGRHLDRHHDLMDVQPRNGRRRVGQ